ncbi:MAG: DUF1822 family protein [Coleofasciculus sp. B1-GNL1-01]|uniref:DUF1822 family protein n=1 Tax=Coleofasciculus sp. B1-GNL1-01 TaxID=3068484 RepID=UPI0033023998
MFNLLELSRTYPNQIWLNLSEEQQKQAWQRSQNHANAMTRCNAYLNELCLTAFIPWLEGWCQEGQENEKLTQIRTFPESSLPSIWEFINGSLINFGNIRLALIPTDSTDLDEVCVPQEWVDIVSWRADYYLAVQINLDSPDTSWMRLWGYISYQKLKPIAIYEESDRAYYISGQYLTPDLTLMLLQPEPVFPKNVQVESIPSLTQETAERLLAQLSQSSVSTPRLAVSYDQWAAFVTNEKWRQDLYERRLRQVQRVAKPDPHRINLGQWWQNIFESGWQSLDVFLNQNSVQVAVSFRHRRSQRNPERQVYVEGIKVIDLGIELNNQAVALLVGLAREIDERIGVRVQLYPVGETPILPPNIRVALLSQSGAILQEYQARIHDNLIQLKRFTCPVGKQFSIRVALGEFSITENFAIAPFATDE